MCSREEDFIKFYLNNLNIGLDSCIKSSFFNPLGHF